MAHFTQRDVREQRKNRKRAFLCIFLFIPLLLAGYFLFAISNKTLNSETVEKIVLSSKQTKTITLTERADIKLIMDAVAGAKKITQSARPLSEYTEVTFVCSDKYTKDTWRMYFSKSANDALLLNEEDRVYMLQSEDALRLMTDDLFAFLYKIAPPKLTLKLGEEERSVSPTYSWHYFVADGTERQTKNDEVTNTKFTTDKLPVFDIADTPDDVKLSVTVGTDVKTGTFADLATFLQNAKKADVRITASWANPEADGYYGTAEYAFILEYTAEA
ncbi:MAG: hypothetical protein IKT43_03330 [Clostridia bacterium]|nr:hypothetical protein [Clostridia bacterium]